ncbi:mannonate dehydratase [Paramicrobacterium chengjingii]|uniref:mannonate dehydratase n=1 Tax=Paramicrobacterium chengjingii TaxID=2769067 RepID=UPI001AB04E18|nr:mannonate dehydratase [Microbacterium chengjingii]
MKVGLSIPGALQTKETFAFARQMGVTHIVAHIVGGKPGMSFDEILAGPGFPTYANDERYSLDGLLSLKEQVESSGMELFAIENFEPADWYDVLLDGPKRNEQMERVKEVVRNVGSAGIPTMGYNFSIAGVWGRPMLPNERGGALSSTYDNTVQTPIPKGMVWNAVYDQGLYERSVHNEDFIDPISADQLWDRYSRFLREIIPVAEHAGVVMALHPDDPPLEELRDSPRLIHRGHLYDRMLRIVDTPANSLEFCVGTLSEMPDQDIYEVVEHFVATGRIQYVHLRNVAGRVPQYRETFLDDGYVDMQRILRILKNGGFDGVVIPDHTPFVSTSSPWHTGMAWALGWIRASMRAIDALDE